MSATVLDLPEVQIRLDTKVSLSRKTSNFARLLSNIVFGDKGQSAYVSKGGQSYLSGDLSGWLWADFFRESAGQVDRSKSMEIISPTVMLSSFAISNERGSIQMLPTSRALWTVRLSSS